MSFEHLMKQIELLTVMMGEDRPTVEKQIIEQKLFDLYSVKISQELASRLQEAQAPFGV